MSEITITLTELGAIVLVAVGLSSTDAAALSRLLVAYAAKKMGIEPHEIMQYGAATDGDGEKVDDHDT